MDLAVYITELLGLQGEACLPGIGCFAQVRINGYYNEQENKFYPPTHEVSFEPQLKDDDEGLAKYIAGKKNISLASSKYFIDKYVIGIKQQVALNRVEIAGLGYLYTNGSVLAFRADNSSKETDPAFYGFPPVNIPQPEENPVTNYTPPVEEETKVEETFEKPIPTIIPSEPVAEEETILDEVQEYEYEEPEESGRRNVWVALLLIIIIVLLALLGLYKYKPNWFDRFREKPQTFVAVSPDTVKKVPIKDTTKSALKQDTVAKTAVKPQAVTTPQKPISTAVDTFATLRYEILGGAFKTLAQANAVIKNYQKLGLQPRLISHTTGKNHIITLGTYFNKEQAQKAEDSISVATKLRKGPDIFLQTYNPKK